MVTVKLLKTKSTQAVTNVVEELFQYEKPKYLRVDAGGEFLSISLLQCVDVITLTCTLLWNQ